MDEPTVLTWDKAQLQLLGLINSDHQWAQFVADIQDFVHNWFEGQVFPE